MSYAVRPLTPSRWDDLLELFGERGAYSGRWCMFYRQSGKEFTANAHGGNRRAFKALVDGRRTPGLLAYDGGTVVGWCSVAPRGEFGRIERSPVVKPADDLTGVWSLVCFYIDRNHRGRGVATALLEAAEAYARKRGARWLEAYPVDPFGGRSGSAAVRKIDNATAFVGVASMFENAGFEVVTRRKPGRPIMRKRL